MIRNIVIYLFVIINLYSQDLIVLDKPIVNKITLDISYYIDISGNMPLDQVLDQNFTKGVSHLNLGINTNVTWVSVVMTNKTDIEKKLYLHNSFTYLSSKVNFYELDGKKILNEREYSSEQNINIDQLDGAEESVNLTV